MANIEKEYALYHGDDLLILGTMKQISEFTGKKITTLYSYSNKRYLNKNGYLLIEIKLEEEDEE